MNEVYEKRGRRYVKLGYQFAGFPADGIWLVQNGRNSQSCLIGLKESVPVYALNYRLHEQELCQLLQDYDKRHMSYMDKARGICDFIAGKVKGHNENT